MLDANLDYLYRKGETYLKKHIFYKNDDRISRYSLLQIFCEDKKFITHKATQICLNVSFHSAEIPQSKAKIFKVIN